MFGFLKVELTLLLELILQS